MRKHASFMILVLYPRIRSSMRKRLTSVSSLPRVEEYLSMVMRRETRTPSFDRRLVKDEADGSVKNFWDPDVSLQMCSMFLL